MFHQSQTISYLVPVFQGNLTPAFPVCHAISLCSVAAKKQSEHGNMIVDCSSSTHRRLHYCATLLLISYNSTYHQLVFIGPVYCLVFQPRNGLLAVCTRNRTMYRE